MHPHAGRRGLRLVDSQPSTQENALALCPTCVNDAPVMAASFLSAKELRDYLQKTEPTFDPLVGLYQKPGYDNGYHTRLTSRDMTHPTRDNFDLVIALLMTGEVSDQERAAGMLRKLLPVQGHYLDASDLRHLAVVLRGTTREDESAGLELGRFLRAAGRARFASSRGCSPAGTGR